MSDEERTSDKVLQLKESMSLGEPERAMALPVMPTSQKGKESAF